MTMSRAGTQQRPTRVLYELYDVFPAGKGSSRRTRELLKSHGWNNLEFRLVCKSKKGYQEDTFPFSITRLTPKYLSGEEGKTEVSSPKDPVEEGLGYRRSFANLVEVELGSRSFDIGHSRCPWAGVVLGRQRKTGKHFVYEANGFPSIELPYICPKWAKQSKKLLRKLAQNEMFSVFAADQIIVVSDVTTNYLTARGVSPEKIMKIPNGVNFKEFKPQSIPVKSKKELFHAPEHPYDPDNDLIVGFIGSFQPWQGVIPLVKSLSLLVEEVPHIKLVLAGKSRFSWRKSLRKLAKESGVREHLIIIKEERTLSRLPLLVNAFDYAIAPLEFTPRNTEMGCNPIKLYEYAACEVPTIMSDLAVCREIFPPNSNTALFIQPPESPELLAEEIISHLNKPEKAEAVGKNSRRHLLESRTSWQVRREQLSQCYSNVLAVKSD